jgi:hypothetical protein
LAILSDGTGEDGVVGVTWQVGERETTVEYVVKGYGRTRREWDAWVDGIVDSVGVDGVLESLTGEVGEAFDGPFGPVFVSELTEL